MSNETSWIEKLRSRWKLKSAFQVLVVLLVFALTGTTVLLIKGPVLGLISEEARSSLWFNILYLLLILPIYNVFLLLYGFVFGQFSFFWEFEKRFFRRLSGKRNNKKG